MKLRRLINDKAGANLVEYIILVGIVALVAVVGFKVFGTKVDQKIKNQANAIGGINDSIGG